MGLNLFAAAVVAVAVAAAVLTYHFLVPLLLQLHNWTFFHDFHVFIYGIYIKSTVQHKNLHFPKIKKKNKKEIFVPD